MKVTNTNARLPPVHTVVEALALRGWARCVLGHRAAPAPDASTASLGLFVEAERCFLRLTQRLTSSDVVIPTALEKRLLAQAAAEGIRVRSAKRQLERIADIVSKRDWPVVVLKGGVSVLAPEQAVDMVDLDLLAPPAAARELAAELDRVGYGASGAGTSRHLATRSIGAELPIDIHVTLNRNGKPLPEDIWQRLRPVASMGGLHILSAPDHLWHLLDHVVNDHPERMGSTRELLLLKGAVAQCSDTEWRGILARIAAHPKRRVLTCLLEATRGESDGSSWSSVDRASAVAYAARLFL